MSFLLAIQGKASAEVEKMIRAFEAGEQVDDVAIIVHGSLRAVETAKTAHRGRDQVAKFSMNSALLATGAEGEELLERLEEVRAEERASKTEAGGQQNVADAVDDEYSGLSHAEARELCKTRSLNAKGSRLELIQRLREND